MKPTQRCILTSWSIALAIAAAAVFFLFPLVVARNIPLIDPDEGLHASIAQEMVERGDWVVPRLLGKPFLDKPILYFWAEACSLQCFGMSEAAVRLPGLLFGLLGAVTTGAVAWRLCGRTTGLVAGLFYTTSALPLALSQAAAHDVALVPWVNLAILSFWESDHVQTRRAALAWASVAGLVLGLAILTKGLVGIALVGGTYGGYLIFTRQLRLASCFRGMLAVAIAALIASTWYWAVEQRNPGYLHYYFIQRHVLGFTTDTQRHGGAPWWYYLPVFAAGGMPWIAYLPVLIQDAWLKRRSRAAQPMEATAAAERPARGDHPLVLLAVWLVGCTLFLSASHSKLVTYFWPVFPAGAILAAVVWGRLLEGQLTEGARRSVAGVIWGTCVLGLFAMPFLPILAQRYFDIRFPLTVWIVMLMVSLATWAPIWCWVTGRPWGTLVSAMVALAGIFVVVMSMVVPQVAAEVSARELAGYFNHRGEFPSRLVVAEGRVGSLVFYLRHEIRTGLRKGQLTMLKLEQPIQGSPLAPSGEMLVLPEGHVEDAKACFDLAGAAFERAGRYRLYTSEELNSSIRTATIDSVKRF